MPLPLLLLLGNLLGLLALFLPPDGIPFRIFLVFLLPQLLEIGFMDRELGLFVEGSRTENGR